MRVLSHKLLCSVAATAMIASVPTAAFAFDEVEWAWHKKVDELVDIDITIEDNFDTTGMTQIEKLQIQIGDVKAKSVVNGIDNNRPTDGSGGGFVDIDETFTFSTTTDDSSDPSTVIGPVVGGDDGTTDVDATLLSGGTLDEGTDQLDFEVQVTGTVEVPAGDAGSLDAEIELPTVESAATAVGNNQAITSEVATYLHDAQILFDVDCDGRRGGDFARGGHGGGGCDVEPLNLEDDAIGGLAAIGGALATGGNTHTAIAAVGAILAINGTIEKADIAASSEVYDILNARVDSTATAVGNNMSVDVNPDGNLGDSVLIADITQLSVADISARSHVYDVSINNYTNLNGVAPIVSSAATAVGNNVSINVGNVGN